MPSFRPRISLLAALLLMTIAGMAIVIVQLWREVGPLRQEVGRLRQELGYLSIHDETKLYVIEVPVSDPDSRRFRVFLPKNETFTMYTRYPTIPGRTPQMTRQGWLASLLERRSGSSATIAGGEHTIDIQLRRNPEKEDPWDFTFDVLRTLRGTAGSTMPWLNDRRAWSISSEARIGGQRELEPTDGIVLFALRQAIIKKGRQSSYSKYRPDESAENPGIMLWIAPASAIE